MVGQVDPATVGIPKRVMPAKERMTQLRAAFPRASSVQGGEISHAPSKGTINNLVVFITEFRSEIASPSYPFLADWSGLAAIASHA